MKRMRVLALGVAFTVATAPAGGAPAGSGPPATTPSGIRREPIVFTIRNVNRSALACASDGKAYDIHGELVGPAGPLPRRAALALHEFSFGRFFWSFRHAPASDYAAHLARAGQATVVIDRLGYDASGHPPGMATCLGAQADIAAQVVRALRSGAYRTAGRASTAFPEIVLAGHSVGGGIAELAAHSFPDLRLSGLMLFAWADQSYSAGTVRQSLEQGADCAQGGQPAEPGTPSGYAWFGRTEADFRRNMFFDAEWSVMRLATAMRNRDPCGDNATLARLAVVNRLGVGKLAIPVLLVSGEKDPVFQEGAAEQQARLFSSSPRVTVHRIPRSAHALTLERSAPMLRGHALRFLGDPTGTS